MYVGGRGGGCVYVGTPWVLVCHSVDGTQFPCLGGWSWESGSMHGVSVGENMDISKAHSHEGKEDVYTCVPRVCLGCVS